MCCQTSNVSGALVGNKIVDHSDEVGALPGGDAPTTRQETFKFLDLVHIYIRDLMWLSSSQVEYDLENSGKDDLRILSMDRIEQSAVPLCMDWYPPVTKESFIVTANDQVSRDHSGYGLSQWEMTLQCKVISHWVSP